MKTAIFLVLIIFFPEGLISFPSALPSQSNRFFILSSVIDGSSFRETGIITKSADFWTGRPDLGSSMIFLKLPAGTQVEILEREMAYLKVLHRNLIGYVEEKMVRIVLVESDPDVPAKKKVVQQEAPEYKPVPQSAASVFHVVTLETSLRAAADSKAKVYIRLQEGYKVEVLEDSGRWWWKVRYQNRTGWAKRALLKKE